MVELFHRAWVKSGEDQVRGDYIWYDAVSEKYLVTAGETSGQKGPPGRVRAIIQPKGKDVDATSTPRGEPLDLKGTSTLGGQNAR